MNTGDGGSFYEKPDQEHCQVRFDGCQGTPSVRISCRVEGASLMSCGFCHGEWQRRVGIDESGKLKDRCPRCATWNQYQTGARAAEPMPPPLEGVTANVIDAAMHSEGILLDVRQRVLRRLAKEASWLGGPDPIFIVNKELTEEEVAQVRHRLEEIWAR